MSVAAAIAAYRTAVEADEALFNADGDLLVSPQEAEASEKLCKAAWMDLMSAPCLLMDDVRAKVEFITGPDLRTFYPVIDELVPCGCDPFDAAGPLRAFLASLSPKSDQPDPFVERMAIYAKEIETYNANEDDGDEPGGAFCEEVRAGKIAIGNAEGAILALRRTLAIDCIIDTEDDVMVEAVIAFLERGRVA